MTDLAALAFHAHDHAGCTSDGLAQAEAMTRARGLRLTPVRRRTLEILLESHRAMGAYDVLAELDRGGFGKQPPVAYRALEFLVDLGLVHRISRLNAFAACTHPGEAHMPAFLICRLCHALAEAPAATVHGALQIAAEAHGFQIERVSIEAIGLCPLCAAVPPDRTAAPDNDTAGSPGVA